MSEFPYPYGVRLPDIKIPPLKPRPKLNPQRLGILLTVLAACFALINVTVVPACDPQLEPRGSELWMAFSFGVIGAQAGLLAIAAVLGPGKGLVRHLFVVPLAVTLVLAWVLGYGLAKWTHSNRYFYPEWKEVAAAMLVVPLMFCACEAPLWFFRTFFRWRIDLAMHDGSRRKPPQLSIAGILLATVAVAIAMASVRLGRSYLGSGTSEADWWGGCGIAVAFAGGISLVTLPLCTWATLRCPSLLAGICAMIAWLVTIAGTLICIISVMVGDWPPLNSDFWLAMLGLNFGFAFGLLGTLSLVRTCGYRLWWGREDLQFKVGDGMSPHNLIASASAGPSEAPASPKP